MERQSQVPISEDKQGAHLHVKCEQCHEQGQARLVSTASDTKLLQPTWHPKQLAADQNGPPPWHEATPVKPTSPENISITHNLRDSFSFPSWKITLSRVSENYLTTILD